MEPVIPLGRSNNGRNLLPKEKILIFLHCSAKYASNFDVGKHLHVGEGTVRNSFLQVLEALHAPNPTYNGKSFVEEQIHLPGANEARARGEIFLERQPFPKAFPPCIIASLDGFHAKASSLVICS